MTQDTHEQVNASRKVKGLRLRTLVTLIIVGSLAAVLAGGAFLSSTKATGGGAGSSTLQLRTIRLTRVPYGQTVTLYSTHGIQLRARCIEEWNPIGKDGIDNFEMTGQHVGYMFFENISATDAGTISAGPDNDHGPIGEDHHEKEQFLIGQEQNIVTGHALGNDNDFGGAEANGGGASEGFVQHGDGASFHVFQAMASINLFNSDCAFSAVFAVEPVGGNHNYGDGCSWNNDDDHRRWYYGN